MNTTYTHTGRKASVGYMHYGNTDAFRGGAKAGKVHALNKSGSGYVAVCGVTVPEYCHDHRCDEKNPVELSTVSPKVTCKACLRAKPVAVEVPKRIKFVVMLDTMEGEMRWCSSSPTRDHAERYAASIQAAGTASQTQPAGFVTRAWVVEVQE